MLNFMIIVDDGGELKPVTMLELRDALGRPEIEHEIEDALNTILDKRAIAEGTYDPSDNDTPIIVTMGPVKDDTDGGSD